MSKVYLVNIGANSSDSSRARCPLFPDGSFVYVPFSYEVGASDHRQPYPEPSRPFIRNMDGRSTHPDPDWKGLTYGDNCSNPRASSLLKAQENDILLFWALLWHNTGSGWSGFTGDRCWGFIGALRVRAVVTPEGSLGKLSDSQHLRAKNNIHYGKGHLNQGERIFIGCTRHSTLFSKAIDWQVRQSDGLLYRTIRSARDQPLSPTGQPRWSSSLRSARVIWDLDISEQRKRASIAGNAISKQADFGMLRDL